MITDDEDGSNERDEEGDSNEQVTGTIRTDWRGYTHPTTAVIERVAAATDRNATALPSLHESVDTDGLDALVTGVVEGDGRVEVSFSYLDLWITVRSDRTMVLRPDG